MTRPTLSPKTIVKSIEQQNADFTAEGSPPPGTAGTSIHLKATPPDKSGGSKNSPGERWRPTLGLPKQSAPKLPHERDESINTVGTVPSEPMKQASRDIKRGLTDTDRGAEVGRTYKKLKQSR